MRRHLLSLTYHRFDLVCNSQHGTVERPFEWWQTTFRESIAAIGRVALVLAPWADPIPLTRCWCLFEIFTAIAAGEGEVELQVRLPASQRPAFVEALAGDFEVVMDTLVRVESERAEAFLEKDQERIHAAIKSSEGGHAQLDALVKDQLRAWLLRETLAAAKAREEAAAALYSSAASVANAFGEHDEALEYYAKALAIYRDVLGERHPSTAGTYNGMATVFKNQGKHAEALEYYAKALAIRRDVLGERHPDTATTYNNMAVVFKNQGKHAEALEYYAKALAIYREVLGERHPSTANTYWGLANVHSQLGDKSQARELYGKAHEIYLATLGPDHEHTIFMAKKAAK
jgi:tetratricopeptide (TPR) repeat protein